MSLPRYGDFQSIRTRDLSWLDISGTPPVAGSLLTIGMNPHLPDRASWTRDPSLNSVSLVGGGTLTYSGGSLLVNGTPVGGGVPSDISCNSITTSSILLRDISNQPLSIFTFIPLAYIQNAATGFVSPLTFTGISVVRDLPSFWPGLNVINYVHLAYRCNLQLFDSANVSIVTISHAGLTDGFEYITPSIPGPATAPAKYSIYFQ
jgi:hypothetical protein